MAFLAGWERSPDLSFPAENNDCPRYASASEPSELRGQSVKSAKSAQVVGNFAALAIHGESAIIALAAKFTHVAFFYLIVSRTRKRRTQTRIRRLRFRLTRKETVMTAVQDLTKKHCASCESGIPA